MMNNKVSQHGKKIRRIIPDDNVKLHKICVNEAERLYGSPLPDMVKERLKIELSTIEENGYASHYLIGKMITDESLKEGYPVTSRGMIGSSFIAYLCHMTSANPLPPHYRCDDCHYFEPYDMDSSGKLILGYDLPEKLCPVCLSYLNPIGADIFPEILMGYNLDKEPDITLNVASEIRPALVNFMKKSFGDDSIFRAGVRMVLDDGSIRRNVHPGGIFILPEEVDITEITPLREDIPDDDFHIPVTELDYHELDKTLKKLDLLTIQELSLLHTMEDVTGFDSNQIRTNDSEVMEEFLHNGFDYPSERNSLVTTDILNAAFKETHPRSFSDLVRISGLMRGTGTWNDNGEKLIKEGKALHELITCRDDIMQYLIDKGIEKKHSYNIMNQIRRGKGLTDDMEHDMRNANVPDWYIESCNKIKYLFPRSHVVEYMLLYWKLAYYRLHYPDKYEIAVRKYCID